MVLNANPFELGVVLLLQFVRYHSIGYKTNKQLGFYITKTTVFLAKIKLLFTKTSELELIICEVYFTYLRKNGDIDF